MCVWLGLWLSVWFWELMGVWSTRFKCNTMTVSTVKWIEKPSKKNNCLSVDTPILTVVHVNQTPGIIIIGSQLTTASGWCQCYSAFMFTLVVVNVKWMHNIPAWSVLQKISSWRVWHLNTMNTAKEICDQNFSRVPSK